MVIQILFKHSQHTQDDIEFFVNKLANTKLDLCYNPYCSEDLAKDAIRKNNLKIYLHSMKKINPRVILVGEAPGYRGAHWTGLIFNIYISFESNLNIN